MTRQDRSCLFPSGLTGPLPFPNYMMSPITIPTLVWQDHDHPHAERAGSGSFQGVKTAPALPAATSTRVAEKMDA